MPTQALLSDLDSLSNIEAQKTVAEAIVHREKEVFSYRLNIANYNAMLAAGAFPEAEAGELQNRIASENLQLQRSLVVLDALRKFLPDDQRTQLVQAAAADLSVAQAAAPTN